MKIDSEKEIREVLGKISIKTKTFKLKVVSTDLSAMLIITDTAMVVLMPINRLKAVRAT